MILPADQAGLAENQHQHAELLEDLVVSAVNKIFLELHSKTELSRSPEAPTSRRRSEDTKPHLTSLPGESEWIVTEFVCRGDLVL